MSASAPPKPSAAEIFSLKVFGMKLFYTVPLYSWYEWEKVFMVKLLPRRNKKVLKVVIATLVHYCGRNGRDALTSLLVFS